MGCCQSKEVVAADVFPPPQQPRGDDDISESEVSQADSEAVDSPDVAQPEPDPLGVEHVFKTEVPDGTPGIFLVLRAWVFAWAVL